MNKKTSHKIPGTAKAAHPIEIRRWRAVFAGGDAVITFGFSGVIVI
jgi:hypothetical protein